MCMWFGFNPAINFCHFSTLLTLSVCAGAKSTSPKFYLFLKYFCFSIVDKFIIKVVTNVFIALKGTHL